MSLPNQAFFNSRRVTSPDQSEIVRQRLYDHLLYPLAGSLALNFFATAIGGGIATAVGAAVGSAKTIADTNLQIANTLPSGKAWLFESIEVYFYPGSSAAANTFVLARWGTVLTVASGAIFDAALDTQLFYASGVLKFDVLDKNQLTETPLRSFPPKTWMELDVAMSTAVGGTTLEILAQNSYPNGRPYILDPEISIQPAVNFGVSLTWPGLVAMPSGFNGRVGVYFDGGQMRASQ